MRSFSEIENEYTTLPNEFGTSSVTRVYLGGYLMKPDAIMRHICPKSVYVKRSQ